MTNIETINSELTAIEVDEILEKIHAYEETIAAAESERDAFIERYQEKINAAREICEQNSKDAQEAIEYLTERLRQYAVTKVTDKKRSIKLPSGTLSFRKTPPKYFFGGNEVSGKSIELLDFARNCAPEYVKTVTTESVDWTALKGKLSIGEDGTVAYSETGEVIDGLKAQILPDKFTVKIV